MNTEKKNWKLVNFCEFDPYAVKSYCAIHNVDESINLGDITKVDETNIEPFTMIVGGSPCQDFSVAGKQKGSVWTCKDCGNEYNPLTVHFSKRDKCPNCGKENLDKSRSSLLVEWLRIIRANKPNFGIYENVKNIVGKQFKETTFKLFTDELEEYGYNVYWKVLNAKDYGVPQNRERVYLILIKKELDNGKFTYPKNFYNGIRLRHVLEAIVDEKYYINNEKAKKLLDIISTQEGSKLQKLDMCAVDKSINNTKIIERANCITSREDRGISNHQAEGTAVLEVKGGMKFNHTEVPCIYDDRDKGFGVKTSDVCPTQRAERNGIKAIVVDENENLRLRKLTPKECFRLMGFTDDNFYAAQKQVSNCQLYKQAGNSIVTDVIYYILVELYKAMPYLFDDLRLSSYFSGIGAFEIALNRLYDGINVGNFIKPQLV